MIITLGQTVKLTILDPFKPADTMVTKIDKSLVGAVIYITMARGDAKPARLTTGKDSTATARLPVAARGNLLRGDRDAAPEGYQLDFTPVRITAKPGAPTAAAFTNTKKVQSTRPPTTLALTPTNPAILPTTPSEPTSTPEPCTSASASTAPAPTRLSGPIPYLT
ncbi:hypothetical protein ABT084_18770 [Streptomyces sp. NPDC002138]|uniref:hypothetical protein n=1 Tax=Streptomyces sp. NPDC002138 TaxID=3154410 RepID=UPI00332A138B